ncbi:MAG: hypothetical protein KAS32_31535, partial [Candidatus Peribacteraceae bacterium]|nr:hypothetical protein [Candidatus Peribacteraceae bacterium]
WDDERPFHTGVKGNSITPDGVSSILRTIKEVDNIDIGVSVNTNGYDTLRDVVSIGNHWWDKFNTTIIAGTESDYDRGVLPDISNHLKCGTIPLIHHNHKWFHSLFKRFIMFDHSEVVWYNKMFETCHYGFMDEIYKNIDEYLPEMITENFVKSIVEMGEM